MPPNFFVTYTTVPTATTNPMFKAWSIIQYWKSSRPSIHTFKYGSTIQSAHIYLNFKAPINQIRHALPSSHPSKSTLFPKTKTKGFITSLTNAANTTNKIILQSPFWLSLTMHKDVLSPTSPSILTWGSIDLPVMNHNNKAMINCCEGWFLPISVKIAHHHLNCLT